MTIYKSFNFKFANFIFCLYYVHFCSLKKYTLTSCLCTVASKKNCSSKSCFDAMENALTVLNVITRVRRKIVGAPHQSATVPHRYIFAASVNRGSFYNTSALHWIVMVGGILDALTIFRRSLVITYHHVI
jgi:hypothetical protein